MEEELPSTTNIGKADDREFQEITENAARSTENLIAVSQGQETLPLHKLLGFDIELKGIRCLLKVETVKKAEFQQHIEREKRKLVAIQDNPEYDDGIREDIRIAELKDKLKVRQEGISLLKGRFTSKITGMKETIAKVQYKNVSLAK